MTLLALSEIGYWEMKRGLYLNEIEAIIRYHHEHHNLSRLAYQSAWQFLIFRIYKDYSLEDVIVNELHFGREAARELKELRESVDWKRKEERGKEAKEVIVIWRWINAIDNYLTWCALWSEELVGFLGSIVQVFREVKDNHREVIYKCIYSLKNAAESRVIKVEELLKNEAVDVVLEEIHQPKLYDKMTYECLLFFLHISERLKEKEYFESDDKVRKTSKRVIFEKIEEEGYEDIISSFLETFDSLNIKLYPYLSLKISDYFVNV
eukprot:MONOS_1682.1-p1 / transcript=MONOS_1682.1 / gene=MONOS_1682 / organism=Monocercomonoides_exilis_PA203 / gene_product=unspecified product / transcript_product=unspecified product / location=Mono_scaffold00031:84316-85172(-) / protein_length=265 / sequence_SO=supercontig / SO=protein_coding / is_pseudo=false